MAQQHEIDLTPLEWKVIALALREAGEHGCGGACQPSRFNIILKRMVNFFIGWEGTRPLADPRLETLRRFVCLSRARADVAELWNKLIDLGFSRGQIKAVSMLVAQ